jgi:predicted HicB family RNase H-like nuclease
MKLKAREDIRYVLRIPPYLYEILMKEKEKTLKSINLLIIEALKNKYEKPKNS